MRLLVISKTVQLYEYEKNIQNNETWTEMGKYFDQIHIIVMSPTFKYLKERQGNLFIHWLPKIVRPFDYILFTCFSFLLGLKIVNKNKIDVLNGEIPAYLLKLFCKKPFVLQIQGQLLNLPEETFGIFKRFFIRHITLFLSNKADRIRVVSNEIAQSLIKEGIDKSKIFTVPSRCNTSRFDKNLYTKNRDQLRRKLGYNQNDFVMIFLGRLVLSKDVTSILKAMRILMHQSNPVKILIIGDGELKERLIKESDEFGINEVVNFYDRIPYDQVPNFLSIADIFISPSIDEGMPRSVMEAQSMEVPVIVTPVGGNPEIVKHMETGFIVNTGSPEEIAQTVQYIMKNEEHVKEISEKARSFILNNFDFYSNIEKFASIHYFNIE